MEILKIIVLVIWGLVGLMAIGTTIFGMIFYTQFYKGIFNKDETE
jgi:hypothetical protein